GLDDGSADAAISPALTEAAEAEEAWRAAVASLAAADDELLAAEEALSSIRARESDRIAAAARAAEDAARHAARRDQLDQEREEARTQLASLVAERDRSATLLEEAAAAADRARDGLEAAVAARDATQADVDDTQQRTVQLSEQLRAVRAEMEAIAEPHDAAVRLGRRLARAGWPALLDSFDAPEASWPAIEAVVGGELEGALLWSDGDPTLELE